MRKGILRKVVDNNQVVRNVSFTLHAGETLGLVGESGSGKSTTGLALLRLIASEGNIVFDGQPLQGRNRKQLLPLRIGFRWCSRIRIHRLTRVLTSSRSSRKVYAFTSPPSAQNSASRK
ncbi:Glutathione import ATP-binding protein GsiA [Yokenella regensburgei]|nr:Glutathione import ATP-binding protein GsiA [Yokenella regensburgei]